MGAVQGLPLFRGEGVLLPHTRTARRGTAQRTVLSAVPHAVLCTARMHPLLYSLQAARVQARSVITPAAPRSPPAADPASSCPQTLQGLYHYHHAICSNPCNPLPCTSLPRCPPAAARASRRCSAACSRASWPPCPAYPRTSRRRQCSTPTWRARRRQREARYAIRTSRADRRHATRPDTATCRGWRRQRAAASNSPSMPCRTEWQGRGRHATGPNTVRHADLVREGPAA